VSADSSYRIAAVVLRVQELYLDGGGSAMNTLKGAAK